MRPLTIDQRVMIDQRGYLDACPHATLLVQSDLVALALARDGILIFANGAFSALFGRTEGIVGIAILDLIAPTHREPMRTVFDDASAARRVCVAGAVRSDGSAFEVELLLTTLMFDGEPHLAIAAEDITARHRAEIQLSLLAYSDPLTGLANRAMFTDRLRLAMRNARETLQPLALCVLDLDSFKAVNDRLGHDAGDRVLQRIAQRFLTCLRDTDTIARLGGDEFAVLLPTLKVPGDVDAIARRLIETAQRPIQLDHDEVQIGCSLGIARFPEHASTVDQLFAAADLALYVAKRLGRGRYAWAPLLSAADCMPISLTWNAAHQVGIAEIDEQHARLAVLLNELAGVLRNGEDHTAVLDEIVRYTEFHFAAEELLMERYGYDGAVMHRHLHRQLLDEIRSLGLEQEETSVSRILRYLQEWLLHHVATADRELADALHAAGVQ